MLNLDRFLKRQSAAKHFIQEGAELLIYIVKIEKKYRTEVSAASEAVMMGGRRRRRRGHGLEDAVEACCPAPPPVSEYRATWQHYFRLLHHTNIIPWPLWPPDTKLGPQDWPADTFCSC